MTTLSTPVGTTPTLAGGANRAQADADPRLAKYQEKTREAAEWLGRTVKIAPELFKDMTDGSVTPEHQRWAEEIHAQASEAFWIPGGPISPQQAERAAIAADKLIGALEDQLRLQRGDDPRSLWERIKDLL